jgi:hypothetical protein
MKFSKFFLFSLILLHPHDTYCTNSNYPDISEVDVKFTSLYRYFKLHTYTFGHSFSLLESQYHHENYSLEAGFYLEKFMDSEYQSGLNHLSMKWWNDDFEFKIGKYVTKIGVLDYIPTLDILNPTRVSFYNDKNKNIKKYPKWMAQGDLFVQDDIKLTFFAKEYEDRISDYYYMGKHAVLDHFIPYFLANLPNQYSNYIGNSAFLPLYNTIFKPMINQSLSYTTEYAYEMLSDDLKHGTFGINALFDIDDISVGIVWFNTYAQIPLLTPTEALRDILLNTDQQELEDSIINYLKGTPLNQLIKPVRYDKFGIYTEGYIGPFGYRSEFSFQDNYPILDRLGDIYSFAFGMDHKLWRIYNSLEVKCSHIPRFDHNLYQGVLASKLDPIHFNFFDLKLENAIYFIKYGNLNYYFSYPAITLSYNNFDVSLEYYYSSDKAYMEDSFIVKLRMVF